VIEAALLKYPADSEMRLLGSVVAAEVGSYDEAIERLNKLILSDGIAGAYACLGWILCDERRDYAEAVAVLSEGHERFPHDSSISNNLAYAYLMLGNVANARGILLGVPEREVMGSVYLSATMGLLKLHEGEFETASGHYALAEQLAGQMGSRLLVRTVRQKMHLEFAKAYLRLGDAVNAQAHLKLGLAIEGRPSYADDLRNMQSQLPEIR
jgi:tetratricopeptide (TPR) repeat protein